MVTRGDTQFNKVACEDSLYTTMKQWHRVHGTQVGWGLI